jgi:hypothetical protein
MLVVWILAQLIWKKLFTSKLHRKGAVWIVTRIIIFKICLHINSVNFKLLLIWYIGKSYLSWTRQLPLHLTINIIRKELINHDFYVWANSNTPLFWGPNCFIIWTRKKLEMIFGLKLYIKSGHFICYCEITWNVYNCKNTSVITSSVILTCLRHMPLYKGSRLEGIIFNFNNKIHNYDLIQFLTIISHF